LLKIVLISTYELGRQPFGLASPAAWLRADGHQVTCADLARGPLWRAALHHDTVRDAGKYDGPLGVMVALACVERLHARGERLPFALEVYAFADEEGLRYRTLYLGSAVVAGIFDPATLAREDADGIPLAEAIRAFGGDKDTA